MKLFIKLPNWFKVPTPIGDYNPDWAILVNNPEGERLYLVVETKNPSGLLLTDGLRDVEKKKIDCGKAHFKALAVGDDPASYLAARSLDEVLLFESSST
jgi:type III restriction enzyme